MDQKFTLFWLTGDRNVVTGPDIATAMNQAGWGGGSIRALDFYASGDNQDYEWDAGERGWKRRAPPTSQ